MSKRKRTINRPSYKAEVAKHLETIKGLEAKLNEMQERNMDMHEKAVEGLLMQITDLRGELAERDKQLDQSRSASVILAFGWRRWMDDDLDDGGEQLSIVNLQDACRESAIEPINLGKELHIALVGSYDLHLERQLKKL